MQKKAKAVRRREFLVRTAAGCTGVLAVGPGGLQAAEMASGAQAEAGPFTVRCYDNKGEPLKAGALQGLFLTEAGGDRNPLPNPSREVKDGLVRMEAPRGTFGVSQMLNVEGFGTVRLYTDTPGFRAGQEIVLNRELARTRLALLEPLAAAGKEAPLASPKTAERIKKARALLRQADAVEADVKKSVPLTMQALAELLWASEELVVARAQRRIARTGARKGFLFGCNFFGYPGQGEEYAEKFAGLFNFATLPLYWRSFEPEEGKPKFENVDSRLPRLEKSGITAKGHPLCWFHEAGCPKWMMGRTFEEWKQSQKRRITEIVKRYAGRIRVYDVINEAHDWGNDPQFSQEQLLEMTRLASDATREADPKAIRVVNNCTLFAEYVASGYTYKGKQPRPVRSPLQYLRALQRAEVSFEAIGLQVYYPEHDLFEIAGMLDRFARLGKPLHVTELGVCSKADRDEKSLVKTPTGNYWHAPWSESVQADWIEQFYTICYGHPAVDAVTWWDFSDAGGHFWPHGGFLRGDLQPKESYMRLQKLIGSWNKMK